MPILICPSCRAAISITIVPGQETTAKCIGCGHELVIAAEVPRATPADNPQPAETPRKRTTRRDYGMRPRNSRPEGLSTAGIVTIVLGAFVVVGVLFYFASRNVFDRRPKKALRGDPQLGPVGVPLRHQAADDDDDDDEFEPPANGVVDPLTPRVEIRLTKKEFQKLKDNGIGPGGNKIKVVGQLDADESRGRKAVVRNAKISPNEMAAVSAPDLVDSLELDRKKTLHKYGAPGSLCLEGDFEAVDEAKRTITLKGLRPPPTLDEIAENIRLQSDKDPAIRMKGVTRIRQMGTAAHSAAPGLIRALDDPEGPNRNPTVDALVAIGRRPTTAVLVFSADWCGPCREMKPIVERLIGEGLPIHRIDIDRDQSLSELFRVESLPTFVVLKNDKEIDRCVGSMPEFGLRKLMKVAGPRQPLVVDAAKDEPNATLASLVIAQSSSDPWTRFASSLQLRDSAKSVFPELCRMFDGKYPQRLRLSVIRALGEMKNGKERTPEIAAFLNRVAADGKESAATRAYAALGITDDKKSDPKLAPVLIAAFSDVAPADLRERAATRLAEWRVPEAVPVLAKQLQLEGDSSFRRNIIRALHRMGSRAGPAVPALVEACIAANGGEVRNEAIEALREIAPMAKDAVPALMHGLEMGDDNSRAILVEILRTVDDRRPVAAQLPKIRKLLVKGDPKLRLRIAELLFDFGERNDVIIDTIIKWTEDKDVNMWQLSSEPKATKRLVECIVDSKQPLNVRIRAANAYAKIEVGDEVLDGRLNSALRGRNSESRACAAIALARRASKFPDVGNALIDGLGTDDMQLKLRCVYSLATVRSPEAVPALLDAMNDEDDEVVSAAGDTLGNYVLNDQTVNRLIKLLEKVETRGPAANALRGARNKTRAAAALIQSLEPDERLFQAENTLASLGRPAVNQLIQLYENRTKNVLIRWKALEILSRMPDESEYSIPIIARHLNDAEPADREHIAITLANLGDARGITVLTAALKAEDPSSEVLRALGLLRSKATPALDGLSKVLGSKDEEQRLLAIDAIAAIGVKSDAVIVKLVELLNKIEPLAIRQRAAYSMQQFGKPAIPRLTRALSDDSKSQTEVILALRELGEVARESESALVRLLDSNDHKITFGAAVTLLKLGSTNARAVEVAIGLEGSSDDEDRRSIVLALRRLGKKARPAIPVLIRALDDAEIRDSAASALGQIGPDAATAVEPLTQMLHTRARNSAAIALGQIGPASAPAIPTLMQLLEKRESIHVAAAALRKIGGDAKNAIPTLLKRVAAKDLDACTALGDLGKLDLEPSLAALTKIVKDDSPRVRQAAISALGQLDSTLSTPVLIAALKDPEDVVRESAILSIRQLGAKAATAVKPLIDLVESSDQSLHSMAIAALGSIGEASEPAMPLLIKALDEKDTRYSAIKALGGVGKKAQKSIPRLIEMLDNKETRVAVAETLGMMGPTAKNALPKLRALLADADDDDVRDILQAAIKKIE